MVYGEIYSQLKETLFSFHDSFFSLMCRLEWFRFCLPLTSVGVTHIILKNRIYDPAILPLILKGYIHNSQAMV